MPSNNNPTNNNEPIARTENLSGVEVTATNLKPATNPITINNIDNRGEFPQTLLERNDVSSSSLIYDPYRDKNRPNVRDYDFDNEYIKGYSVGQTDITKKIKSQYGNWPEAAWEVGPILSTEPTEDLHSFRTYNYGYHDENFNYEDPLYESFDIQIDTQNSALFKGMKLYSTNTSNENPVRNFLQNSGYNIDDLTNRVKLHEEFVNTFFRIFSPEFKHNLPGFKSNKAYYINQIDGLDKLNAKIVKYREDKITITLHEDVSYLSTYIAELYNNLYYSYSNQRVMVPDNLLRFNIKIKMTDFRNFKNTKTKPSILYTLYDCNFEFHDSRSFTGGLVSAGIQQSIPTASVLPFNIYYKSIGREFYSPIVNASPLYLDNKSKQPSVSAVSEQGLATFINNSYKEKITPKRKRSLLLDSLVGELENQARGIGRSIVRKLNLSDPLNDIASNLYYGLSAEGFLAKKGQELIQNIGKKVIDKIDDDGFNGLGKIDMSSNNRLPRSGDENDIDLGSIDTKSSPIKSEDLGKDETC